MFVSKVRHHHSEAHDPQRRYVGAHPKHFNAKRESRQSEECCNAIDSIELDVFAEHIPLRAEHEEFVSRIRHGDGKHVSAHCDHHVVNSVVEQVIRSGIDTITKHSVPPTGDQVSDFLPCEQPGKAVKTALVKWF